MRGTRLKRGRLVLPEAGADIREQSYWLDQREPESEHWSEPIPPPRLPQAWESYLRADDLQHDQALRRAISRELALAETGGAGMKAPASTGAGRVAGRVERKEPLR